MISAHYQRGTILFGQRNYRQAWEEFKRQLGQAPDNSSTHGMLSLCLIALDRTDEATYHAERAIHLAPERAFGHYVLARVLISRNCLDQALRAINEALRLDADNAEFFGVRAGIHYYRHEIHGALASADQGLAVQPENEMCLGFRAMALAALGDPTGATATICSALAMRPDHAHTHTSQGWTQLQLRQFVEARKHFREALRIDPECDWAREGMSEALKSRNILYRTFLGKSHFAPMFNVLLRMDTFGRHLLSSDQVSGTNVAIAFVVAIFACIALAIALRSPLFVYFSFVLFLTSLQAGAVYLCGPGRRRWTIAALTLGLLAMGLGMPMVRLAQSTTTPWFITLVSCGLLFFSLAVVVRVVTNLLVRTSLQH